MGGSLRPRKVRVGGTRWAGPLLAAGGAAPRRGGRRLKPPTARLGRVAGGKVCKSNGGVAPSLGSAGRPGSDSNLTAAPQWSARALSRSSLAAPPQAKRRARQSNNQAISARLATRTSAADRSGPDGSASASSRGRPKVSAEPSLARELGDEVKGRFRCELGPDAKLYKIRSKWRPWLGPRPPIWRGFLHNAMLDLGRYPRVKSCGEFPLTM